MDLRRKRGAEGGREYDGSWMDDTAPPRSTIMKVSFSLAKKPETPSTFQLKKPAQKPPLFNADDDGEDPLAPGSKSNGTNGIGIQTVSAETSKAQKKRELAEMVVDSTVYQYDEVWDKMQVAKQKVKEAKVAESKERKVRLVTSVSPYLVNLLKRIVP